MISEVCWRFYLYTLFACLANYFMCKLRWLAWLASLFDHYACSWLLIYIFFNLFLQQNHTNLPICIHSYMLQCIPTEALYKRVNCPLSYSCRSLKQWMDVLAGPFTSNIDLILNTVYYQLFCMCNFDLFLHYQQRVVFVVF